MNSISQTGLKTSIPVDALCSALTIPRATYYRHLNRAEKDPLAMSPSKPPENAWGEQEKQVIIDLLHSARFIDKTPYEVYYGLIDQGEYHCSIRTMYRVLGYYKAARTSEMGLFSFVRHHGYF